MAHSIVDAARRHAWLAPALVTTLACSTASDTSPPPDSGAIADSGTVTDTGARMDGGAAPHDSGATVDAAKHDAGIHLDAGTMDATGPSTGLVVQVTNSCPIDVWIHGVGQEGTLAPDNVHLAPGASQRYNPPLTWTAARIYAYLEAPDSSGTPQGQNDKVEMNFGTTNGSEWTNTDVTYVDWLALPSRIQAIGSGSGCTTVGCEVPYAQILNGCPPSLLSGRECLSAGSYCLNPSADGDPFCHLLDSQVSGCASEYSDCAGAAGSTTAEVYSCSGAFFSQNPEYCAALNRGVLAEPGATTPPSAFYMTAPFNQYSAWVHQTCPAIYAFPYDDYGSSNQSSDETCTGATQLNITFCPQG